MTCNGTVILNYYGRYGNMLFIYFIGRLYAEKYNLNLITNIENMYFKINNPVNYGVPPNDLKTYQINDNLYNKETNNLPYYGPGKYIFNGYFQYENIFFENKEKILNYIDLKYEKKDICTIHVRLDDYFLPNNRHLIINKNYYLDCIKKYGNKYEKIYIVCDKLRYDWEKDYMSQLIEGIKNINKEPIYFENSIMEDLMILYQSNCIITSNSTFCFWASFFSKSDKIIAFPYTGMDISYNKNIKEWSNKPIIFKYNNDNYISNLDYSNNIIDYFEDIF